MVKVNGAAVSIPCMEGGSGQDSYCNNSLLQNHNFHAFAKPHLSEALDHLVHHLFPHSIQGDIDIAHTPCTKAPPSTPSPSFPATCTHITAAAPQHHHHDKAMQLNVADFGCSYGSNALEYTAFIVQGLHSRFRNQLLIAASKLTGDAEESAALDVEMQYFFSDLPSNDFNALFQSLCLAEQVLQQYCMDHEGAGAVNPGLKWKVFSRGVAGSFHGQLFPTSSLRLAISTYALHWLSQVPLEVLDTNSPAWNGGHIWIHGTRPKTVEAYARQFQKDLKSFLLNRAKEIASGGILFLFFPCRSQKDPQGAFFTPHHDIWTGCYESTWEEMVLEGQITKEERDMYNIPFYICHKAEMQEVLEEFLNDFKVVKMEVMRDCSNLPKEEEQKIKEDPQAFGKFVASFVASLLKPMVKEHINESRANDLFRRLEIQATKQASLSTSLTYDMLFAVIQRV